MPLAGRVVAAVTGGMLHRRLDRLYDDSHGADQPAESFGRPGFAGDVNRTALPFAGIALLVLAVRTRAQWRVRATRRRMAAAASSSRSRG